MVDDSLVSFMLLLDHDIMQCYSSLISRLSFTYRSHNVLVTKNRIVLVNATFIHGTSWVHAYTCFPILVLSLI
jgi:hypothetical protein